MRLLCAGHGITFLTVTFIADRVGLKPIKRIALDVYMDELRDYCRSHAVPLVDLHRAYEEVIDKKSPFGGDHYPPSRQVAKFIADHLADKLTPFISAGAGIVAAEV